MTRLIKQDIDYGRSTGQVTTIIGNTVTTGFMIANNVYAAHVDAENITGTYITGKVIRTASSGNRLMLLDSNFGDKTVSWVDSGNTLKAQIGYDFAGTLQILAPVIYLTTLTTGVKIQGDTYPSVSSAYNLGTSSYHWNYLYITGISLNGGAVQTSWPTGGTTTLSGLTIDTSKSWGGYNITGLGSLTPNSAGSYNLGSTGTYWYAVNAQYFTMQGSGLADFIVGKLRLPVGSNRY